MQTDINKSKYGKEELALLLIFAIGLALSYMLVHIRGQIKLSPPIELRDSGLSMRIPLGSTWKSTGKWQFNPKENSFDLSSTLQLGNRVEGKVICRYSLASEPIPAPDRFSVDDMGPQTAITAEGQISIGQIDIYFQQISMGGSISDTYIAQADLPDGRVLEIFIYAAADEKTAGIILRSLCDSIEFEHNQLLEKGRQFADHLKRQGAANLIRSETGKDGQRLYLFKKSVGSAENDDYEGFAINVFRNATESGGWVAISGETFYHAGNINGVSSNSLYQISDNFDRMIWQTKLSSRASRNEETIEIEFADDGSMRITQLSPANEQTFWPSQAAIPEILLDSAVRAFLDQGNDNILLDVVSSRGSILPTLLSRLDISEFPELSGRQIRYGVRIDLAHMPGQGQNAFFDAEKNIVAKVDLSKPNLTWIRTDKETLLTASEFNAWREHIIRILNK